MRAGKRERERSDCEILKEVVADAIVDMHIAGTSG